MIRSLAQRPLRPLALVTVVGGASGYLWYATNQSRTNSSSTFDIQIKTRGPDGRPIPTARTLPLLSMSDVEHKVRQNASSTTIGRPNGLVWHYDTAFLAANDPIEDANAQALVERKASGAFPSGDLLFFAVMDGHGGFDTSRLLAKALIPSVALELTSLESAPFSDASSKPVHSPQSSTLSYLKSLLTRSHSTASKPYQFDADPKYVSAGIKAAFAKLDSEIVNSPIRLLESIEASPSNSPAHEHPMALPTMLPALSGSCALLAMLDTARRDLYVACTGDSRAVAGYWDEDANGQGRWRVEVLTEDQTGRNPNELKRMQSEHPSEEASYVIQRGRVLGGLEPSRAFGDSIYKWPKDLHAK
jgi:pyruvate dehydrogenase phosphatase